MKRRRRRRWVESRCCTDDGDELARGSHGPIAGQDVAPLGLGGTRQVDRDPTAAADPLDGPAVDLELARPNLNAGRLESERIAARQRTAAQRAGDDLPASSDRERPIHGQSRWTGAPGGRRTHGTGHGAMHGNAHALEGSPKLVEARTGRRRDRHDR